MSDNFLSHDPVIAADFIEKWEGCVLHAYKATPSEAYWTIGVGHYGADVHEGDQISWEESRDMLIDDIHKVAYQLAPCVNVPVTDNQYIAIVSLAFNVGAGRVKRSKMLRALNSYRFDDAAKEFLDFDMAGGVRLRGLTRRRKAEHDLFLTEDE